ncbi:MAG TPA: right-handed parallel beta-helix repeat-containing protein [Candidatus Competibacteraceae bacterium]|nr:right-handed parallel beta-helix repeat-containing protein [Candidatus Competibacteraceae bacterium]
MALRHATYAVIGFLLAPWGAAAAAPTVFYSDLTSAPVGAYVTLWGREFGEKPGSVRVGKADAKGTDILSWRDNMIEFRLPAGAGDGISVVDSAGRSSATLPFRTRQGRLFYVSKATGNNRNDGRAETPRGRSGPWRDLAPVLPKVRPGDVVYVREGTYNEVDNERWGTTLFIRRRAGAGTAEAPIALVGYPGEKAVVGGDGRRGILFEAGQEYWTIAKLSLQAESSALDFTQGRESRGIRIVGNEAGNIRSAYGTIGMKACSDCQILGNHVHNSGQPGKKLAHLIYYGGYGIGANVEIAWNHLHDELGGRCIQVYGHTDDDRLSGLSIHDNYIYNCPFDGILVGKSDAEFKSWVKDAQVYNNVVINAGGAGIRIDSPEVEVRITHNTLYGNGFGLFLQDVGRAEVINNVFADNQRAAVRVDNAPAVEISYNGYQGDRPPPEERQPVVGSAGFLEPRRGDLRLGPQSPFRGRGKSLAKALALPQSGRGQPDLGADLVPPPR